MKKVVLFLAFISMSLLVSCSGKGPEGVAKKFLTHASKGEFDEAKKYCDDTTGAMLGMADSFMPADKKEEMKKKDVNIEIVSSDVKDDTAIVTYKTEESTEEKTLDLKKIDGEWKVSINKEGANKEGAAPPPPPTEEEYIEEGDIKIGEPTKAEAGSDSI